jgi:hypothetical protein
MRNVREAHLKPRHLAAKCRVSLQQHRIVRLLVRIGWPLHATRSDDCIGHPRLNQRILCLLFPVQHTPEKIERGRRPSKLRGSEGRDHDEAFDPAGLGLLD